MSKLPVIIGGLMFVAVAFITLVSDKNWQGFLLLLAIGIGFFIFLRGEG